MPHKLPFRVVHVTCQDENYPATELNHHSPATRGWVSSRFCTFPQQLIFVLEERAHLRKIQLLSHQYLIASKIEFFVGDLRDDDIRHYENARYTRLGYVSLSDNRSTEFKARELKSVHVDAMGTFVQLLLHKNYTNEHNLYNQVGLIAINLIGDPVRKFPGSTNVLSGGSGAKNRPDFIPPTEDLAFDIYQDPEVANIIRKLEKQKQACVSQEKFDEAQKIRDAIGYLHRVGERLGRLALEKQQAVEEENYERAKLKKFQISVLRTNLYKDLDLINLLSQDIPLVGRVQANGDCADPLFTYESDTKGQIKRPDPIRLQALQELSMQAVLTQSTTETNRARSPSPNRRHSSSPSRRGTLHPMDPDERPLPALHRQRDSRSSVSVTKPTEPDYDDRTLSDQVSIMSVDPSSALDLPVLVPTTGASGQALAPIEDEGTEDFESEEWGDEQQNSGQEHESRPSVPTNPVTTGQHSNQPEPLSESNRRLASVAIDAVGLEMVTMALSKVWAFREKALLELEKRVTAPQLLPPASQPDSAEPDPRGELRAITFLMKRALEDQVLSIFRLAVHFLKPLVIDFVERYMIPRPELHYALDKLLPVLFRRTGDTAVRIREVAKKQVLSMAQWPQLRQSTAYWSEVLRPFSTVTLDRLALSRMELVTELYAARGIDSAPLPSSEPIGGGSQNGFTLEAVVFFTAQALTHRSNEVREAAENLMVALYRAENRSMIRSCLPSADDVKTQRHPLYRRLLGKFERIDIKYAPVDAPPNGAVPDATKKQKDLEALQAEVQQVRAMIQAGVSRAHVSPARAERGRPSKVKPVKQRRSNMRQSNPSSSTHAHALTRSETEATTKTKGVTTVTRQSPRSPRRGAISSGGLRATGLV
ncbi:hypothetical protein FGIG_07563 [Fasciola gigantica]|uniref:UVR domain-containing protein n=1 Tax=Fasciola gigantica TaxID=46835 RepID=A0A504YR63_FASGI|nr:hypothetical protein FGIG_07563 [Fasciola gigantica]